jgi:hypothetical protein
MQFLRELYLFVLRLRYWPEATFYLALFYTSLSCLSVIYNDDERITIIFSACMSLNVYGMPPMP